MTVKKFFITGDTHGQTATRIKNLFTKFNIKDKKEVGLIILGDAGINYYLDNRDIKAKKKIEYLGISIYCVRGNHEERPELIEGMQTKYDASVDGYVYYEPEYPHINYFIDGNEYKINKYRTLVIGGAYSVDKDFRLARGGQWFPQEQLSEDEREKIANQIKNKRYDLVLSHTCPISWEPTDLFLNCIDQSTVDKSTEVWMEKIKDMFKWQIWCFGHFHADRIERPHVEMFFNDIEELDTVWLRWHKYRTDGELDWWLDKSPNFYMY